MEGGSYYDSDLLQESADEVVDRIPECHLCVMELKNADPKQQQEAADKLRSQVDATARQLSTEQFGKWEAEVHARVFNLLNGEVRAAIRAATSIHCDAVGGRKPVVFVSGVVHFNLSRVVPSFAIPVVVVCLPWFALLFISDSR